MGAAPAGSGQGSPRAAEHTAPGQPPDRAGETAGGRAGERPLTVRVRPRSTLPPLDRRGRTEGAHRGRGAPPAEPRGCLGSTWRRFPLFLSARRRRRRLLGKKKKRVPGSSCWKVSAKPPPSAAVPPKSSPSPDEAAAAARAAQTLGACSGRRPGSDPSGCFSSRHPEGAPEGRLTSARPRPGAKARDLGEVHAVNPLKMVVPEEGRGAITIGKQALII